MDGLSFLSEVCCTVRQENRVFPTEDSLETESEYSVDEKIDCPPKSIKILDERWRYQRKNRQDRRSLLKEVRARERLLGVELQSNLGGKKGFVKYIRLDQETCRWFIDEASCGLKPKLKNKGKEISVRAEEILNYISSFPGTKRLKIQLRHNNVHQRTIIEMTTVYNKIRDRLKAETISLPGKGALISRLEELLHDKESLDNLLEEMKIKVRKFKQSLKV